MFRRYAQLALVIAMVKKTGSSVVTSIKVEVDTSSYSKDFVENVIDPILSADKTTLVDTIRGKKTEINITALNNKYGVEFDLSKRATIKQSTVGEDGKKVRKTVTLPRQVVGVMSSIRAGLFHTQDDFEQIKEIAGEASRAQ